MLDVTTSISCGVIVLHLYGFLEDDNKLKLKLSKPVEAMDYMNESIYGLT
jgi:hypothetical protein